MPTKKVITSVSLTPEGKRALVQLAESEGVSVTAIVEQMIRAKARSRKISLKPTEKAS
jgi:hypothetical protein